MTTLEEIETVLPQLTAPELARLETLASELRHARPAPVARSNDALPWTLPKVKGGLKVPLEELHDISAEEESTRSLPH